MLVNNKMLATNHSLICMQIPKLYACMMHSTDSSTRVQLCRRMHCEHLPNHFFLFSGVSDVIRNEMSMVCMEKKLKEATLRRWRLKMLQ